MKTKARLTIEEHRKIGSWLNDPAIRIVSVQVPNKCGKTALAGRLAIKIGDVIMRLKSEMEASAYHDGFGSEATDIYYPQPTKNEH